MQESPFPLPSWEIAVPRLFSPLFFLFPSFASSEVSEERLLFFSSPIPCPLPSPPLAGRASSLALIDLPLFLPLRLYGFLFFLSLGRRYLCLRSMKSILFFPAVMLRTGVFFLFFFHLSTGRDSGPRIFSFIFLLETPFLSLLFSPCRSERYEAMRERQRTSFLPPCDDLLSSPSFGRRVNEVGEVSLFSPPLRHCLGDARFLFFFFLFSLPHRKDRRRKLRPFLFPPYCEVLLTFPPFSLPLKES